MIAGDVLDYDLSPQAFTQGQTPPDNRANSVWIGSEKALHSLELVRGNEVGAEDLATALRTSRAAFDLTFWAPSSVSWVWFRSEDAQLRADLEQAMAVAANELLSYLAQTRPVVDNEKPAAGFAAALVLHLRAWRVPGAQVPPPQLHAHCLLIGVVDEGSRLRPASGDALYEETMTREIGAFGRAVLAEGLVKLGFQIEAGTGYQGRYFEIDGVPKGLLQPDAWRHAVCCRPDDDH